MVELTADKSSAQEAATRVPERGKLLETVAREWLVKTKQA
jgi:hypothetical protein